MTYVWPEWANQRLRMMLTQSTATWLMRTSTVAMVTQVRQLVQAASCRDVYVHTTHNALITLSLLPSLATRWHCIQPHCTIAHSKPSGRPTNITPHILVTIDTASYITNHNMVHDMDNTTNTTKSHISPFNLQVGEKLGQSLTPSEIWGE